jgi:hypothetical protein
LPGESRTQAQNKCAEVASLVPAKLIELGEQALVAVTTGVARGAPLVQCQLLASDFYEALRRELRAASHSDPAERDLLIAAASQCGRVGKVGISTDAMLRELRGALVMLQPCDRPVSENRSARPRPTLRVIKGGLSKR